MAGPGRARGWPSAQPDGVHHRSIRSALAAGRSVVSLSGLRVVVAGAGAVGSAVALTLVRNGAAVVLADPAAMGGNASSVAAGMLAPAMEAALDATSGDHFALLRTARDCWPAFLEGVAGEGAGLHRSGALWVGDEASQAGVLGQLAALGASADRMASAEAHAMSPGLQAPAGGVFTPEDWRLDPAGMLMALRHAFIELGGEWRGFAITDFDGASVGFGDGERIPADALVLATGLAPQGWMQAPPEVRDLTPIKGQLLRFPGGEPRSGPCIRGDGVYVVPGASAATAGATMEPGANDRKIDPEASSRLFRLASGLFPDLPRARMAPEVGVRSTTNDGLPLVGPSSLPAVFLAMGARRNGWLLAPLMAKVLADRLAGVAPSAFSALFDPQRPSISLPA